MGDLKDWAGTNDSWTYWKFDDGNLEAVYKGFAIEDNKYGKSPVYTFDLDGEVVKLASTSKILAKQMDEVKIDCSVIIKRIGTGASTTYKVKVLPF